MKRIIIFYRDIFQNGGVPNEKRRLAAAFSSSYEVILIGRKGENFSGIDNKRIKTFAYENIWELRTIINSFDNIDLCLMVGVLIPDNIFISNKLKTKANILVISPISQCMEEIFKGKIFVSNPEVRSLESEAQYKPKIRTKIFHELSPILKKLFIILFGKKMIQKADRIAVFSSEERLQVSKAFGLSNDKFVTLNWGIDRAPQTLSHGNFYRDSLHISDSKKNYIFWGRLDLYYKGLDRLIDAITSAKEIERDLPFRVFLAGPDYRDSLTTIRSMLLRNNLESDVLFLSPGDYHPGDHSPLRDADYSILLSRWDGFPRALRESLSLGVPIIVSKETHFEDIINRFSCGVCVHDTDKSAGLGRQLIAIANQDKPNIDPELINALQWENIARDFAAQVAI